MSSAELTAWCRIEGLRRDDVSNALWRDRKLIKTWAMRQTLHLLPAHEHGMWMAALTRPDKPKTAAWLAYFGISQNELQRITEAVREALQDRMLTREELADEIARITGLKKVHDKLRMGWGTLLKPACYKGYLCFGPNRGQNTQFVFPGELAVSENAGADATRRYLAAYGPATEREFARWMWGGARRARQLLDLLGEEAVQVDVEGTAAWMLRKHLKPLLQNETVRTVRLLPAFDQYVFASGMRSDRLLPGDFHSRIYRSQGWYSPVLLVDGGMAGVWRFAQKGRGVTVTIEPFEPLKTRDRKAAAEEAERLADFMDRRLELRWV
jgi:hypothetical protein